MSLKDVAKDIAGNIGQGILDQLTGRVYLRDWQHAAKTFLPGGYGNAGKVKFEFHTYFSINEAAYAPPTGQNYGLLVKQVKLPTFNMEVQEMNQYNRKRLIQSKIKYQPIDITFHDDNMSQVTAMWDAYYRYNYADSWNPTISRFTEGSSSGSTKNYNRRNIYDPSISGDTEYGYRGDVRGAPGSPQATSGEKVPFFNNITVYGLWAGNFIAYTLINPIITSFDHDTYDYADGAGTMQNRMTIDYETVLYNTGEIGEEREDGTRELTGDLVEGFGADANYDNRQSPLEQGGSNISDIFKNMESLGGDDSLLEKARTVGRIYDGGLDTVVDSAKKAVTEGLTETVLNKLGLGPEADTSAFFPTDASSPDMTQFNNQSSFSSNGQPVAPDPTDSPTAGMQTSGM